MKIASEKTERDVELDDFNQNNQQEDYWFNGTVFTSQQLKKNQNLPIRQIKLHNQITRDSTQYSVAYCNNKKIASILSQFFPHKWLMEITNVFKEKPELCTNKRSTEEKIAAFLGFVEIYLNLRRLTILDSTIEEINVRLGINIEKMMVRQWKIKILRCLPELKKNYLKNFKKTRNSLFLGTVTKIMNEEMQLPDLPNNMIFQIKQRCLKIARELIRLGKNEHMKNQEAWARAICIKAFKDLHPNYHTYLFPELDVKILKMTENKRWQLDTLVVIPYK